MNRQKQAQIGERKTTKKIDRKKCKQILLINIETIPFGLSWRFVLLCALRMWLTTRRIQTKPRNEIEWSTTKQKKSEKKAVYMSWAIWKRNIKKEQQKRVKNTGHTHNWAVIRNAKKRTHAWLLAITARQQCDTQQSAPRNIQKIYSVPSGIESVLVIHTYMHTYIYIYVHFVIILSMSQQRECDEIVQWHTTQTKHNAIAQW